MVGIRKLPREEQRLWEREYYARNREKELAKVKRWQAANPEKVLQARRAFSPQRAITQRKVRYGITQEQYEAMFAAQDGKCAICRRVLLLTGTRLEKPHVDHDHATGKVRGLLCDNCNRGIGHLRESTEVLASAITYLKKGLD